jgi:GNAT superfamily N-acetyltransferase
VLGFAVGEGLVPAEIVDASSGPMLDAARALIDEYGQSIKSFAACSLEHQGFGDELAGLPGKYAPPRGRLLLALLDEIPVGCVALRPLDRLGADVCELKRMYVRPTARGHGIGRLLAERFLDEARRCGYRLVKLDTATNPAFEAAIALYGSLGFTACANYNDDPDPSSLWFEKAL